MKVNCRSTFGTRTRGRSNRFSLGSKDSVLEEGGDQLGPNFLSSGKCMGKRTYRLRSPPKVNKVH